MVFDNKPVWRVTHPLEKKRLIAILANLKILLSLWQRILGEFLTARRTAFSDLGFFLSFCTFMAHPRPFCAAIALLVISALAPALHAQSAAANNAIAVDFNDLGLAPCQSG
jgi:hypothetical protein